MKLFPIDTPAGITDALAIDMRAFRLFPGLTADFEVQNDASHVLRVAFDNPFIARVLSESAISTEDAWPEEGVVPGQFAYRVEGSLFENSQSQSWKATHRPTHWRFLTAGMCLDVLAKHPPAFSLMRLADAQPI